MTHQAKLLRFLSVVLLLIPYFLYVGFIIAEDRGPVDYETFMTIGSRLLAGNPVYGENSYYPLPFVLVFAVFSWLPRALSMALWFLAPPLVALAMTRWNPLVLVFAPLLSHFLGGQTAIFGMLGLWGYRKFASPQDKIGGVFLALTLLKPQLGLVPLAFAVSQWWRAFRTNRQIPNQFWAWLGGMALIFLPVFFIQPDWLIQWLSDPRPLAERAMSGFIPRTLLLLNIPSTMVFWLALILSAAIVFVGIFLFFQKKMTLDLVVLWGFIASPLVHDYDLIQLIPLLDKPLLHRASLLVSIPGWFVILFAYTDNAAWYVFTLIAPGILIALMIEEYRRKKLSDGIKPSGKPD